MISLRPGQTRGNFRSILSRYRQNSAHTTFQPTWLYIPRRAEKEVTHRNSLTLRAKTRFAIGDEFGSSPLDVRGARNCEAIDSANDMGASQSKHEEEHGPNYCAEETRGLLDIHGRRTSQEAYESYDSGWDGNMYSLSDRQVYLRRRPRWNDHTQLCYSSRVLLKVMCSGLERDRYRSLPRYVDYALQKSDQPDWT